MKIMDQPPSPKEARQFSTLPKYDPRKVPGTYGIERNELHDQNGELTEKGIQTVMDAYVRVGRASKAGIKFTTIEKGKKVHFVLDKINLDAVPQKLSYYELPECALDFQDIEKQWKKRGGSLKDVTGQELRYLYRNRDDKQIMQNVIFWKDGKQVNPPWEDPEMQEKWESYRLKLIGRDLRRVSNIFAYDHRMKISDRSAYDRRIKNRSEYLIKGVRTIASNFRYFEK